MEYKLEGYLDKRRIPLSSNTIKIDFDILQDLVFEANQQDKYTTKKDIAKKYSKITKYKTRLESPRALDILNLLETPKEKVDRVFENILSSSEPVDLKYIKTAKVKAASDASAWRSKLAQDTNLDISFTNRVLNNNPNYIKNKKLFDYLSASQLLKTELKDMTLSEQLKYADQAILGRPQYSGITMSKGGSKKGRILRDPAHKVMEFALRNFNQNKGQGVVKFFDNKGKLIKYKPGIKIPYQKSNFSYGGKKHYIKDLRKPGYMQKFFPEVYENQTAINKLLNKEVDNPFKKGKKIIFGDLMNKIQVKGYGWSPQAGVLDVLHGSNGVINEPFTNLSFGTRRLNTVLRDIEVGKYGKGLKQKLVKQAFGDLKNLKGDELIEGIVNQQLNIAKQVAKGKTFEKPRVQVAKELLKSNVPLGNRESKQLNQLIIKPPKNFEVAVQALGCRGTKVRLPNKSGGIQTTDCYKKGLEKIKNKQVTDPVDARNMRNVAKASTMIARTGGAAKVAAILGPAGIGLDILFEGALVGNEVLKGKPFKEAWGRSFLSYLGPNRQDPDELEMDRSAGDDPKAQSYVQDVRLENEFYKNFNLYKSMEANDMAYTRDEVLAQMEKTQSIYDQLASKYEDTADPKTDTLAQISKQTGSDGSMSVLNKDTNYRAFEKGQEREAALEGERSVNTTLFGVPINQMTPMKSDALRRQKITDIFEDGQLVGQKMKPEVKAQGMLDYELLKSGAIPGIGYMAEGGLANLTTTVAPQSGPNSKGLESLRKYATKTY